MGPVSDEDMTVLTAQSSHSAVSKANKATLPLVPDGLYVGESQYRTPKTGIEITAFQVVSMFVNNLCP